MSAGEASVETIPLGSVEELRTQAGRYRFLARLLAAPPDASLVEDAVAVGLLESGDESRLEALQVEFTRLFSAPGPTAVPVYQSIYTDTLKIEPSQDEANCGVSFPGGEFKGHLGGTSCQEAANWYRRAGYEVPSTEMSDHISVQLGFLAHLMLAEAREIEMGRGADGLAWRQVRCSFFENFLGRWVGAFCGRLRADGSSLFYRQVAGRLESELSTLTSRENKPCLD
jgi:TorA maturation chaperone TorD